MIPSIQVPSSLPLGEAVPRSVISNSDCNTLEQIRLKVHKVAAELVEIGPLAKQASLCGCAISSKLEEINVLTADISVIVDTALGIRVRDNKNSVYKFYSKAVMYDTFSRLTPEEKMSVQSLDISHCLEITKFPIEILEFENLQYLALPYHHQHTMTDVPISFAKIFPNLGILVGEDGVFKYFF